MKLLGVDYGEKRIGLAFSDTMLNMVLPYGVIKRPTILAQARELSAIITRDNIQKVVVGFPLSQNGAENKNTARVQELAFELQKLTNVPTEFFDERFSSQAADARGGTVSRDEKSAMIILEGYLERNNKTRNQI